MPEEDQEFIEHVFDEFDEDEDSESVVEGSLPRISTTE
jgi:hypothetical protein